MEIMTLVHVIVNKPADLLSILKNTFYSRGPNFRVNSRGLKDAKIKSSRIISHVKTKTVTSRKESLVKIFSPVSSRNVMQ